MWKALDLRIDGSFDYQYSYESDGNSFVATASGDPGCTGTPHTYKVSGTSENGMLRLSLSKE